MKEGKTIYNAQVKNLGKTFITAAAPSVMPQIFICHGQQRRNNMYLFMIYILGQDTVRETSLYRHTKL